MGCSIESCKDKSWLLSLVSVFWSLGNKFMNDSLNFESNGDFTVLYVFSSYS